MSTITPDISSKVSPLEDKDFPPLGKARGSVAQPAPTGRLQIPSEPPETQERLSTYNNLVERFDYSRVRLAAISDIMTDAGLSGIVKDDAELLFTEKAAEPQALYAKIMADVEKMRSSITRPFAKPVAYGSVKGADVCGSCTSQSLEESFGKPYRELQVTQALLQSFSDTCIDAVRESKKHATLCMEGRAKLRATTADLRYKLDLIEKLGFSNGVESVESHDDWRTNRNPIYLTLVRMAEEIDRVFTPARMVIEHAHEAANKKACQEVGDALTLQLYRIFAQRNAVSLLMNAQGYYDQLKAKRPLEGLLTENEAKEGIDTLEFGFEQDFAAFVARENKDILEASNLVLAKDDKEALDILDLAKRDDVEGKESQLSALVNHRAQNLKALRAGLQHLMTRTKDVRGLLNRVYGFAENSGAPTNQTMNDWWYKFDAVPKVLASLLEADKAAIGRMVNPAAHLMEAVCADKLDHAIRVYTNTGNAEGIFSGNKPAGQGAQHTERTHHLGLVIADYKGRLRQIKKFSEGLARAKNELLKKHGQSFLSADHKLAFERVLEQLELVEYAAKCTESQFQQLKDTGSIAQADQADAVEVAVVRRTLPQRIEGLKEELATMQYDADALLSLVKKGITEDLRPGYELTCETLSNRISDLKPRHLDTGKVIEWRLARLGKPSKDSAVLFDQLRLLSLDDVGTELAKREMSHILGQDTDALKKQKATLADSWRGLEKDLRAVENTVKDVSLVLNPPKRTGRFW